MQTLKEIKAIERGKRLRMCRDYAGLNIKDFCKKHSFNTITFGRWEKGNKVSLNDKNVDKICQALLKEGIICTSTWLLEGTGAAPKERTGHYLFQEKDVDKTLTTFSSLLVFSEMEVFQDNNPNAITSVVDTLDMVPYYDLGDHVGGIKLEPHEYDLANNKRCMVKLSGSKKIILRHVHFNDNTIILTGTNATLTHLQPIILKEHAEVEVIAPIIFHRKDLGWIQKKV